MSKRQERNELRIERMESYLTYLVGQVNAVLPTANLTQIELCGIFHSLPEAKFIWGEDGSVSGIQRSDYKYLTDKVFSQLPEILAPETRSGVSSEKALDLGFLTTIMSACGLGDPYSPCGPEVRRLVYHQLKGKPTFDSVRSTNGVVSLIFNGEVIPTEFTIKDLPVSYFKWGFLKLEESKIISDFSSGLIDDKWFDEILKNIKSRLRESTQLLRDLSEGELRIDGDCVIRVTRGEPSVVTLSLGHVIINVHLHEHSCNVDFMLNAKLDNNGGSYKQSHDLHRRIMLNDIDYVGAVNIFDSMLSIEELLSLPKFKEAILDLNSPKSKG